MSSADAQVRLEKLAEKLIEERFPEGLVGTLRRSYSHSSYQDCEDAVAIAFEQLTRHKERRDIGEPRAWMTTVAVNEMNRMVRLAAHERLVIDADDDGDEDDPRDPNLVRWLDPTLDEALTRDAYDYMRDLVDKWPTRNVRAATLLVLEAARVQEPLSNAELAELLAEQTGEDVSTDTARQWRKRGLDRLRDQLVEADLMEDTRK
jgi:DNA-directed RNA polymerase specialized sigma24 family protein